MKDDSGGKIIKEFVALMNEGFLDKKEKGTRKCDRTREKIPGF